MGGAATALHHAMKSRLKQIVLSEKNSGKEMSKGKNKNKRFGKEYRRPAQGHGEKSSSPNAATTVFRRVEKTKSPERIGGCRNGYKNEFWGGIAKRWGGEKPEVVATIAGSGKKIPGPLGATKMKQGEDCSDVKLF